jgi:hypothetical protein
MFELRPTALSARAATSVAISIRQTEPSGIAASEAAPVPRGTGSVPVSAWSAARRGLTRSPWGVGDGPSHLVLRR